MEVCDWIPEGTRLFQFDTHPWGIFDIVQPSAPQQDEHSEMATVVTTHYEFEMYDWRRPNWMFLGFGAGRLDQPLADNSLPPVRTWLLLIPYWFVIAVLFGFTAYGFRSAWTHRRREQLGLCLNCGYDLRASNDKCPECGTEIPKPAGQVHDSV